MKTWQLFSYSNSLSLFLHLFLFVQRLLQALSHGSVLLHAGSDCPEALCQLLGPGLSQPQAALQILPVVI